MWDWPQQRTRSQTLRARQATGVLTKVGYRKIVGIVHASQRTGCKSEAQARSMFELPDLGVRRCSSVSWTSPVDILNFCPEIDLSSYRAEQIDQRAILPVTQDKGDPMPALCRT